MTLFDVPGWSVPDAPVVEATKSRKRKRTTEASPAPSSKIHSVVQNMEKLIASLGKDGASSGQLQKQKSKKRERKGVATEAQPPKREKQTQSNRDARKHSKEPIARSSEAKDSLERRPAKKKKQTKRDDGAKQKPVESPRTLPSKGKEKAVEGLTALQANMKQSLDGARFRWINETLYKSDSSSALEMMRDNPVVFSEYHTGFRHQVHNWPDNPVSHYISSLSSRPAGTVIVDLGCGDAALARALVPQGFVVLSYDLVSDGEFVIEADVCHKIPLPGSEDEDKADSAQVTDIVVCALSLMSTNWIGCIREAWRVLKSKGELKIAEVSSRFTDMESFISVITAVGFKLRSKDESNSHFTLFEFAKVERKRKSEKEWEKLMTRGSVLKPCEYKRR